MDEKNLHEGHRSRMIERFINSPKSFSEHEILEVLLYSVISRRDTNPLAHRLIRECGSLKGVFEASDEVLLSVKGVGKSVVAQIRLTKALVDRITEAKAVKERFDFATMRDKLISLYDGEKYETFSLYLLDKNRMIKGCLSYDGARDDTFDIDIQEVGKAVSVLKPTYAAICHNHPSGNVNPSMNDDNTTLKVMRMLKLYGITLIDHIIVSKDKVFSYFYSRKIDSLKERVDKEF